MVSIEDENVDLVTLNLTKYNNPSKKKPSEFILPDLSCVDFGIVLNAQKLQFIVLQTVIEGFLVSDWEN